MAIIPIGKTFNAGNSGGFGRLFGIAAEVFIKSKLVKCSDTPASGNLAALFSAGNQLQPDKPPLGCGNFQES